MDTDGQRSAHCSALTVLAVSGCGGSSSEKTEATVVFKPMAVWDASSHGAKTQTGSMKGMSASEMKEMQSTAKAAEGMPFLPSTASGEGHFEQVGDHLTGWRRITGLAPYSRDANACMARMAPAALRASRSRIWPSYCPTSLRTAKAKPMELSTWSFTSA